jgi:thiol-disulfide isomerase/thioredoxin
LKNEEGHIDTQPNKLRRRDLVLSVIGGFLILATFFLAFAPDSIWRRSGIETKHEREVGTNFALPDLEGKLWKLEEQRGKIVLVNYWATWCAPCRQETPDLVRLAQSYRAKGLEIVGISLDDDVSLIRPFVAEFNIPYPILLPLDLSNLPENVRAIPTTILYDQQGRKAKRYVGAVSESVLRDDIESLLVEP